MTASETAARRAALLVHALPPAKRRRVMARLGHAARVRLQALVDELVARRVPAAMGSTWLAMLCESDRLADDDARPDAKSRAARLDAAGVADCLRCCEPATVARILQSADWPWRAAMLNHLPDERRAAVLRHLRSDAPPLAPAMLEALCAQLCALAERPGSGPAHGNRSQHPGATVRPNRILGLLRTLTAWLR